MGASSFDPGDVTSTVALSNSNQTATKNATTGTAYAFGAHGKTSGKWRFQVTVGNAVGDMSIGVVGALYLPGSYLGSDNNSIGLDFTATAGVITGGVTKYSTGGANFTNGCVIDVYVDLGLGIVWFARDGVVLNGSPSAGTGGTAMASMTKSWFPAVYLNGAAGAVTINCGQSPFTYTGVAGFSAWDDTAAAVNFSKFQSVAMVIRDVGWFGHGWAETEVMTTSGGTNMLTGSTATASLAPFQGNTSLYGLPNTIDGNTTTFCAFTPSGGAQNQGPMWAAYDLGSNAVRSAAYMAIRGRDGGAGNQSQAPTLFDLWLSDGPAATGTWYKAKMGQTLPAFAATTPGQRQEFALPASLNAYSLSITPGTHAITGGSPALLYGRVMPFWQEMITNGFFDVDTSGWTVVGDAGVTFTAAHGDGALLIPAGDVGYAYQSISVTPGYTYQLAVHFGPGAAAVPAISVGIRANGSEITSFDNSTGNTQIVTFVAPASTIYVSFSGYSRVIVRGGIDKLVSLNSISLRQAGNYLIAGNNPTLHLGYTINVTAGVYTETGHSPSLLIARRMTGAAGTYNLTGASAALLLGYKLSVSGTYALTGAPVTLRAQRFVSTSGTYAITGATNVLLTRKYIMPVTPGVFAITGTTAKLFWGHRLGPTPGVYELDGTTLAMTYRSVNRIFPDPGAYVITGGNVSFVYNRRLSATPSTYALQGLSPQLLAKRVTSLSAGAYAMTGAAVSLVEDHSTIAVHPGSYAIAGADVQMTVQRKLTAAAGTYALTGQNISMTAQRHIQGSGTYALSEPGVSLLASRKLVVAAGTYAITDPPVGLLRVYKISVTPGLYAIAGAPVSFAAARKLSLDNPRAFQITWAASQLTYVRLQGGVRSVTVDILASRYLAVDQQPRYVPVKPQSRYVSAPSQVNRYAAVDPVDDRLRVEPTLDRLDVA